MYLLFLLKILISKPTAGADPNTKLVAVPTVFTVIVMLFAGLAPPTLVPRIVKVSAAVYPVPAFSTVTVYTPPVFSTKNLAPDPVPPEAEIP